MLGLISYVLAAVAVAAGAFAVAGTTSTATTSESIKIHLPPTRAAISVGPLVTAADWNSGAIPVG